MGARRSAKDHGAGAHRSIAPQGGVTGHGGDSAARGVSPSESCRQGNADARRRRGSGGTPQALRASRPVAAANRRQTRKRRRRGRGEAQGGLGTEAGVYNRARSARENARRNN